jgi:hypothetical protein
MEHVQGAVDLVRALPETVVLLGIRRYVHGDVKRRAPARAGDQEKFGGQLRWTWRLSR